MATTKKVADTELSLTLRAVDKATEPLRKLQAQIALLEAPGKIATAQAQLKSLRSPMGPVLEAAKGVGSSLSKVGFEAFALGAKLAGLATVGGAALWHLTKSAVDVGDKLGEVSQRVGLGVDSFASLQFAAAQADVDAEMFNTSLDKLVKNMGEMKAGKGGEFLHFLREISPTFAEQMKGAKTTEQALALLTDAFAKIDDPAKRAVLATHAFGKSGAQMGVFLAQGSAAIQTQQRRFLELAGSQEAFAKGSGDLDNVLRETEVALGGVRNALGGALFPAFSQVAGAVTKFLTVHRDGIATWATGAANAITGWVSGGGMDRLTASLGSIASGVAAFTEAVGGARVVLGGMAAFMAGPLLVSLAQLVPAVYGLSAAFLATPVGWVTAGLAAIGLAAYEIYDNWGPISEWFTGMWETLKRVTGGAGEAIAGVLTLDFNRTLAGWAQSLDGVYEAFMRVVRLQAQVPVLGYFAQKIVDSVDGPGPQGTTIRTGEGLDLGSALSSRAPQSSARVSVSFENLPKGARVKSDPTSSAELDLAMGYAMGGM